MVKLVRNRLSSKRPGGRCYCGGGVVISSGRTLPPVEGVAHVLPELLKGVLHVHTHTLRERERERERE